MSFIAFVALDIQFSPSLSFSLFLQRLVFFTRSPLLFFLAAADQTLRLRGRLAVYLFLKLDELTCLSSSCPRNRWRRDIRFRGGRGRGSDVNSQFRLVAIVVVP